MNQQYFIKSNPLHNSVEQNWQMLKDAIYVAINKCIQLNIYIYICDRPRENRPSSRLGMIVEILVLKFLISITSFCSC